MKARKAVVACEPPDMYDTGPRIQAYLDSVEPIDGPNDSYFNGRDVICRMIANAKHDRRITLKLTTEDIANVLSFIHGSAPKEPRSWWLDPDNAPSQVVGFCIVLQTLEDGLRRRS